MNKTIKNDPAIRITHTKQLVEFLPRQKVIKQTSQLVYNHVIAKMDH